MAWLGADAASLLERLQLTPAQVEKIGNLVKSRCVDLLGSEAHLNAKHQALHYTSTVFVCLGLPF